MPDVRLSGCGAEPLGSYLKALAVLRLVAEQEDSSAEGWWEEDSFVVRSSLGPEELVDFLVDRYRPSPLLAPWNGGSGFGPNDAKASPTAVEAVDTIAASVDPRLATYRRAIDAIGGLTSRPGWHQLDKEQQVALCRNMLPDEAIPWIDATVVLTAESRTFPFLLGTGGNDGRFDFSSNFLQRIAEVLGLRPRPKGASSIRDLAGAVLFGHPGIRLDQVPIGQFDPGAAGGIGSSPLGAAGSLSNPWDLVLILEGALVFASAAARRLSTGTATVGVPFMVAMSVAGHPSAAAESARGELWAPLWSQPASYPELARLIAEGRADFGGHQARNGLDFARAVSTLGVDRGIEQFVRHAFLVRNGLATLAVPVGRLFVRERAGAGLLRQVDRWADRLGWVKNPPGSLVPLIRALDEAQYQVASSDDTAAALQQVLFAVADLEQLVLRSRELSSKVGPVRGLDASDWLPVIQDGSAELELAMALASMRPRADIRLSGQGVLRGLFADLGGRADPPAVSGLATRPVHEVLAEAHARLAYAYPRSSVPLPDGSSGPMRWLGDLQGAVSGLAPAQAFLSGDLNDARLRDFLRACLLLNWSRAATPVESTDAAGTVHPAFAVLAPSFHRRRLPRHYDVPVPPVAASSWPRQLIAGQTEAVVADGIRRLRIAGLSPLVRDARVLASAVDPIRLAAATLVPLTGSGMRLLLDRVATIEQAKVS